MDAYMGEASLYCKKCKPKGAQGPYAEGGGEADTPQHCDGCMAFLENPLTTDGVAWVAEALVDYCQGAGGDKDVLDEWAAFYGDELENQWTAALGWYECMRKLEKCGGTA